MYSLTRKQKLRLIDMQAKAIEKVLRIEKEQLTVRLWPNRFASDYRQDFCNAMQKHYDCLMFKRNQIARSTHGSNVKYVPFEVYLNLKDIATLTGIQQSCWTNLQEKLLHFDAARLAEIFNFMVYIDEFTRCARLIDYYREMLCDRTWDFDPNKQNNYRKEFLDLLYDITIDQPWSKRRINRFSYQPEIADLVEEVARS